MPIFAKDLHFWNIPPGVRTAPVSDCGGKGLYRSTLPPLVLD
jgi:hypothetical protein